MSDVQFFQTRMGRKFYDHTLPALVEAVDRLGSAIAAERRDPAVHELTAYARDFDDSADMELNAAFVASGAAIREAFGRVRTSIAAPRRIPTNV